VTPLPLWNAAEWDAAEWDAAEWDAAEWDAAEWDAAEWDAAEWSCVKTPVPAKSWTYGGAFSLPGGWLRGIPGNGGTNPARG
jgi:hypothetical protein